MQRIRWEFRKDAQEIVENLLRAYAEFLKRIDRPADQLGRLFERIPYRRARIEEATRFGESMFALLNALGKANALYRYVVV
jgi:phosphoenolpyruvate carboxylase